MKHQPVVANSGLVNLFFAFFMMPEPKTSPVSLKSKALYGILVASLGMMSFVVLPQYDFWMVSLILGNILGVFLRKVR
jgi:Na+-translocating ferredoxin:NAD+ oxidoreductase RnfD subunit